VGQERQHYIPRVSLGGLYYLKLIKQDRSPFQNGGNQQTKKKKAKAYLWGMGWRAGTHDTWFDHYQAFYTAAVHYRSH
jgi:hypothetical protein